MLCNSHFKGGYETLRISKRRKGILNWLHLLFPLTPTLEATGLPDSQTLGLSDFPTSWLSASKRTTPTPTRNRFGKQPRFV